MWSANIIYENVSNDVLDKLLKPSLEEVTPYELTNYHLIGQKKYPTTIISIKLKPDTSVPTNTLSETLDECYNKAKELAEEINESRTRDKTLYAVHLSEYVIKGEYDNSETASKLFPTLVLDCAMEAINNKFDEFKEGVSDLCNKLIN